MWLRQHFLLALVCFSVLIFWAHALEDISTELTLGSSYEAKANGGRDSEASRELRTLPLGPSLWQPSKKPRPSPSEQIPQSDHPQHAFPPFQQKQFSSDDAHGEPALTLASLLSRPWLPPAPKAHGAGNEPQPYHWREVGVQRRPKLMFRRPYPALPSVDTSRPTLLRFSDSGSSRGADSATYLPGHEPTTAHSASHHPGAHTGISFTPIAPKPSRERTDGQAEQYSQGPVLAAGRKKRFRSQASSPSILSGMLPHLFGVAATTKDGTDDGDKKAGVIDLSDGESPETSKKDGYEKKRQAAPEQDQKANGGTTSCSNGAKQEAHDDIIRFDEMRRSILNTLKERLTQSQGEYNNKQQGQLARWVNKQLSRAEAMESVAKQRRLANEAQTKDNINIEKCNALTQSLFRQGHTKPPGIRKGPGSTTDGSTNTALPVAQSGQVDGQVIAHTEETEGEVGKQDLLRQWTYKQLGLLEPSAPGSLPSKLNEKGDKSNGDATDADRDATFEAERKEKARIASAKARERRRQADRLICSEPQLLQKFKYLKYYRRCVNENRTPPPDMDFEFGFPGNPPNSWLRWQRPLNLAEHKRMERIYARRHAKDKRKLSSALAKFYNTAAPTIQDGPTASMESVAETKRAPRTSQHLHD